MKLDSSHRAAAALWDFIGREELADLIIRCGWWAGLIVAEELPRGFFLELLLAGHDDVVSQCWAFPQAGLLELGASLPQTDVPGGLQIAFKGHRLAFDHAALLSATAMGFANVDLKRRKCITPLADLLADHANSLHVLRRASTLRHIHAETVVDQNAG